MLLDFNFNLLCLNWYLSVSYTHLRAHETSQDLVCRLLLEKKDLDFENINSKVNTLLKKTRDKIKSRGSIANEITTKGDFIKKIGDYLKINQNNKYLLEVVSLRDSKTAEAIIVELNVTGL